MVAAREITMLRPWFFFREKNGSAKLERSARKKSTA
jgi:hypothetical protein